MKPGRAILISRRRPPAAISLRHPPRGARHRITRGLTAVWAGFLLQCSHSVAGDNVEVTDLGPGVVSFEILGSMLAGPTQYVLSRSLVPAVLAAYNWETGAVTFNRELDFGDDRATGGRAMAMVGDDLYIAMEMEKTHASLVRVRTTTGEVERALPLWPPIRVVWEMAAAPDGLLYLATSRQTQARLFEYNPHNGQLRDFGALETRPRQDARSIAATGDKVYVGLGFNAIDLWAIDRRSGERESILPPELKEYFWLYSLDANERWIAAGTTGPNALLAVIDRQDYSNYRIVDYGGGTIQLLTLVDDTVYFGGGNGVWRFEIATGSLEQLTRMPANRGLFHRDGVVYGTAGSERIGAFDLATGGHRSVNLLEEGVEVGAEPAQSLAAGGGKVFVGGRSVGIRDLATGQLRILPSPGEAKSAVLVDGQLYLGMYTSGRLVRLDPETGRITTLARAPQGQLRPRILHYAPAHRLLLMGTQADELGGGALTIHDLETGQSRSHVNPLGERAVATIASGHGVIYLAAQQADGPLAAWDPGTDRILWKTTPVPGEWVTGLAVLGEHLHGFTDRGRHFVLDPATRGVLRERRHFGRGGRLLEHNGTLYGVTEDLLFKIDAETFEPVVLLDGLNSRWHGWPSLAADETGALYLMREAHVLRVTFQD